MNLGKNFTSNLLVALCAQFFSFLLSVLLSLIAPKIINDVLEFGYWQLFLFYSNYVSLGQLGLVDGLYLREGGKKLNDLDAPAIKAQFQFFVVVQLMIAFCIAIGATFFLADVNRRIVWYAVAVYLLLYNISRFWGFLFQAVNLTKLFSACAIVDRFVVLLLAVPLLLLGNVRYISIIVIYLLGILSASIFMFVNARRILKAKAVKYQQVKKQLWENIYSGAHLMIANLAGTSIIGVGRIVVDHLWGIARFGMFSFALSIASFFLLTINQVSMVLYPALRTKNDFEQQKVIYLRLRKLLVLLVLILPFYYPARIILGWWLPTYLEGLDFLGILLPICLFDSKMQMLYNTYLKALRKERVLLTINLSVLAVSFGLCILAAYLFNEVLAVAIVLVFCIILRSILTEYYIDRLLHVKHSLVSWLEIFLSVCFILCNFFLYFSEVI